VENAVLPQASGDDRLRLMAQEIRFRPDILDHQASGLGIADCLMQDGRQASGLFNRIQVPGDIGNRKTQRQRRRIVGNASPSTAGDLEIVVLAADGSAFNSSTVR
jgi:hypothetical protein